MDPTVKYPFPLWGGQTSHYVRHNEVAGPVFPVERNNKYAEVNPKEAGKEKEQDLKTLAFPVFDIGKTSHTYQVDQISDVTLPPLLIGPKYTPGDGKSGYIPTKPMAEHTPQIDAPVFRGVESSNHFTPTLPPKIEPEVLMSVPMLPVEHGSSYTTQKFGCSGSGLTPEKPKVLAGPGNRDVGDRHAALIESKNKYTPEVSKKEAPPIMHGPKFPNVESSNSYGVVPARVPAAEARMEMPGPVYPGGNNQFCKIDERVHNEPLFIGPKLPGVVEQNEYAPVEERVHGALVLAGPVFGPVEHGNKYIPETTRVDNEGQLVREGPKRRGIDDSSKYNPKMEKAPIEGERLMTAPIFPGIEASNKYGPVEPELAPKEKIGRTEPMVAPKYPNIEAKNKYSLEELENGFPEHAKPGGQRIMTAPKYPGVEESHKYGPVTERKETHKEICVPVYTEDHDNKYMHIPEKRSGEILMPMPVYRGVDPKSDYNPVEEKVVLQPMLAGPLYKGVEHECKFLPESTRVDNESQLVREGPKRRGIDDSSKYNPKMDKAPIEGQRLMTAPAYPGVEASNKYGPAVMGF